MPLANNNELNNKLLHFQICSILHFHQERRWQLTSKCQFRSKRCYSCCEDKGNISSTFQVSTMGRIVNFLKKSMFYYGCTSMILRENWILKSIINIISWNFKNIWCLNIDHHLFRFCLWKQYMLANFEMFHITLDFYQLTHMFIMWHWKFNRNHYIYKYV